MLANISDFDPSRHGVAVAEMVEIDRYALAMAAEMQKAVAADYETYQFHLVAQRLQGFCSEDLGAFYLDILKDRLYTCKADSAARRSAQSALHHVTHSLVRLMAPILSFTAEELWQAFTGAEDDSVFFQTWHELPQPADAGALVAKWTRLRELRNPVRKEIEALRAAGKVGSSLQAEVEFHAEGADHELLRSLGDEAIGMYSCCPYTIDLDTDSNKRFIAAMQKDYGVDPGFYAAGLYVSCQVVEAGLQATGESQRLLDGRSRWCSYINFS